MDEATLELPAASPAPPRRRRWLRRLLLGVCVLGLLVVLAPLAVGLGFVRDRIAERASKEIGAPVRLGGASAWWTSGLTLEDVEVGSPPGHQGPLAQVDRVHVKLALGALLAGEVDAEVTVTRPKVTLRRNAAGRWNSDDLLAQRERAPRASDRREERAGTPGPRVLVRVEEGVVESHEPGGRVERLEAIDLSASLAPDGAASATLALLAAQAGPGGKDVPIALDLTSRPGAPARLKAEVPALDLERFAGLIEGASGLRGADGTLAVKGDATRDEEGRLGGTFRVEAAGLAASTATGARFALERLEATVDVGQGPEGESARGDLRVDGLDVLASAEPGAARWTEKEVRARFAGTRAPTGVITVTALDVTAGPALRAHAKTPLVVTPAESGTQVAGDVELGADLARLAALEAFVPALEPLRSGLLVATVRARPAAGLDLALGARVTGLELDPVGPLTGGYVDRDVTLQAALQRAPDGALRISLHGVGSALATLRGTEPFVVHRSADGRLAFAGPLDLGVDLPTLGRALGTTLGLAPGEALGGSVRVTGRTTGETRAGSLDAQIVATGVALPPSLSASRSLAALRGGLQVAWTDEGLTIDVKEAAAFGAAGTGRARFVAQQTGLVLSQAEANVNADVAEVATWFGPSLGLPPLATVAGRAQVDLRVTGEATPGALRLEGRTRLADLRYRADPGRAPFEEPALTVEHAVALAPGDGPVALTSLKVLGNGYALDLSGSQLGGAGGAVRLTGTLQGEAAALGTRARAFLGESLADLTGRGTVSGRFAFEAPGGPTLERATASADLSLGTWTTSGATLETTRVTLARAKAGAPFALRATTTLNGGAAVASLSLTPQGAAIPWALTLNLTGVDTSTWVTSGAGVRRLAYVLPTLVPSGSKVPVLSGKLDATVELAAADLAGASLAPSLAGRGTLHLTQGTLAQSTLFASLGAPGGFGEVGKALAQVAPGVGRTLTSLARGAAFQVITSRFEIGGERVQVIETRMLGQEHRLDLSGTVTFAQQADLAARLWVGGKGGDELKRVLPDQVIPLRVRGPLATPQVVPDLKATDLLKGALPDPKELLKDPADLLKDPKEGLKKLKDRWKDVFPR